MTAEAQLAAYSGGNQLQGQLAYNLKRGQAPFDTIANAKAMLVVTYTYAADSPSYTNTVFYPLESLDSPAGGSGQTAINNNCTLDSDCPLFNYEVDIPEFSGSHYSSRQSQWFQTYLDNYNHGINDVYVDVNIEGTDENSSTFIHEADQNNEEGYMPVMYFSDVPGYSENQAQALEFRATTQNTAGYLYYLPGGEVAETYIASSSAAEKTRTVTFPLGVLDDGATNATSTGVIDVYFPENGTASGTVTIKKAWWRITGSYPQEDALNYIDVTTKVGDDATSSIATYEYRPGTWIIKSTFNFIHVIPESDYAELENANATSPVQAALTTKNTSNTTYQGGTSAELVITYTYTDEQNGYLTNLDFMAGQSEGDSKRQLATTTLVKAVMPEHDGDKSVLAGAMLASYLISDSDHSVNNAYTFDTNLSVGEPACTNAFISRADGLNSYTEFYRDVSGNLTTAFEQSYTACFSNNGGNDAIDGGAKMNGQLIYTYEYYNPPTVKTLAGYQYKSDISTVIPNNGWTNENEVYLSASATDISTSTYPDLYFNLVPAGGSFSDATTTPAEACWSGDAYGGCTGKIWRASSTVPSDWYDTDWLYRKRITINASQVATTTDSFLVLATTTDPSLAFTGYGGRVASSTGADIIITDSDGLTVLNYEQEYYSSSTGEIVYWIKTDISSTTNKALYLYYGNADINSSLATTTGVWGNDYVMVYHFGEPAGTAGAGSVMDSTGNTAGTPGSVTFGATGPAGYSASFAGSTGINCGTLGPAQLEATTTISFWIYSASNATRQNPFNHSYGGWGTLTKEDPAHGADDNNWYMGSNGGDNQTYTGYNADQITPVGSWYYITLLRHPADNYSYAFYRDGSYYSGGNYSSSYPNIVNHTFTIGYGYTNFPINGRMDEFRVANVVRTSGWIKTEYNNQSDVNSFLNIGEEEPLDFNYAAHITGIPDAASGYKWQAMACNTDGVCSTWDKFDTPPNFKVDTAPPDAPGDLTIDKVESRSVTFNFGDASGETNFAAYRIFYSTSSPVTDTDTESIDGNLAYQDYYGAATTTVSGLQPGTRYYFNIWVYDQYGASASATPISVVTLEHRRARSVEFYAGSYVGNGTTGANSDATNTLPAFDFQLAEDGVNIESAYIVFESHFEAYDNSGGTYSGYNLAFDACQEPCTANPSTGAGRVFRRDNSVLAYDEGAGNQVRLLLDVTKEAQLAANSTHQLQGKLAYRLEAGAAHNSIADAKAKLVVTYTYDSDSPSYTNTVLYPLESAQGTDSGSMQTVQADDCTLDSNCPLFTYNMYLPEIDSSHYSTRLAQWFQTNLLNDVHGINDFYWNVNIEGTDSDSATYIFESALNNEQGNTRPWYFRNVSGYSENQDQTLEMHAWDPAAGGGGNYYLMGGEVEETYTASTSAAVKTRTVILSLGAISDGQTTATTTGSVDVYFPENGAGTGKVHIEKAWFRINGQQAVRTVSHMNVETKVGDTATSSLKRYDYYPGDSVISPPFTIIQVLGDDTYSELESANGATPVSVKISTANTDGTYQGGTSAELVITYTYTEEIDGYLTSLSLFAGQTAVDETGYPSNSKDATTSVARSVLPENDLNGSKTMLAAALRASYLISDSDVNVNTWYTIGADLATATPVCTNTFDARTDGFNTFTEFDRNVTSVLETDNARSYVACYSNNGGADAGSGGAKMNGQLVYTYQYYNPPVVKALTDNQLKSDNATVIPNDGWTDENEVILTGTVTDSIPSTVDSLYFNLVAADASFSDATTTPVNPCFTGSSYGGCSNKIWIASTTAWYDPNWFYRKRLVINSSQVATTTSDFTVLATTTDADLAYLSHGGKVASSTGADIIVTDTDGVTLLNFEREFYASTTGEIVLWIKTDISESSDKAIYLYYGNNSLAADLATTTGAWDDHYQAVWHMDDNTASNVVDSTSGGYTGTKGAVNEPDQTAGWIGYAQNFDGTDEINFGNVLNPGSSDWTIEVWFKPMALGAQTGPILYNKEGVYETSAGGGYYNYAWSPHWNWDATTSFPIAVGEWSYAVNTYDHSSQIVYQDGVKVNSRNQTGDMVSNGNPLYVGRRLSEPILPPSLMK